MISVPSGRDGDHPTDTDEAIELATFSDEELTAQALAADPDQPLADDALPFDGDPREGYLLPAWYMPAPAAVHAGRRRATVAAVIILSLVLVNAVGLCVTNGHLEIAW